MARQATAEKARDPDVLTVNEAAEILRIGRNTLYEAIGRGSVPHRRIGKQIRLSRVALVAWLHDAWSLRVADKAK